MPIVGDDEEVSKVSSERRLRVSGSVSTTTESEWNCCSDDCFDDDTAAVAVESSKHLHPRPEEQPLVW